MSEHTNALIHESSPYLLQHAHNPVDWMPWGDAAFEKARTENKLVFLSIGYATCHWCHVMERESFENETIAEYLNAHFVPVKVDREERPDVDAVYMAVTQGLNEGRGGWPMSVWLTPDKQPITAGTYFPPNDSYGRQGFMSVLQRMVDLWGSEREKLVQQAADITDWLRNQGAPEGSAKLTDGIFKLFFDHMANSFDERYGGFEGSPKFPTPHRLMALMRYHTHTGNTEALRFAEYTLQKMAEGGIHDHIGGGFHRYATDREWLTPHFEKMLYDNALLIEAYLDAFAITGKAGYVDTVHDIAAYVLRDLRDKAGGFHSAEDADSEGEEGKFHVWSEAEVDEVLGKDGTLFKQVYDVSARGNWEGQNILHRLRASQPLDAAQEARLSSMREKLLARRNQRVRPGFDDKVLADWNGLMIAALVNAAETFNRGDWQAAAVKAFWFIAENLGKGDRLSHSWRAGVSTTQGLAEDYANMARAALALYEATSHPPYLERAKAWVKTLNTHFWRQDIGGYAMTADDGDRLIVRVRTVSETVVPSVNGTMMNVLARLFYLTGDADCMARTNILLSTFSEEARNQPFATSTFLNGFDLILRGQQVVIVGTRTDPNVAAFREVLRGASLPNKILSIVAQGEELHEMHPARGKTQVGNRATVYLCTAQACSQPITDPVVLETQLKTRAYQGGAAAGPA
jgi:uncharacterized protein YyaL (SSP411 family)